MPNLREYNDATDREQVMSLWRTVFGYETAHNEPSLAISKKIDANDHRSSSLKTKESWLALQWRDMTATADGSMQ